MANFRLSPWSAMPPEQGEVSAERFAVTSPVVRDVVLLAMTQPWWLASLCQHLPQTKSNNSWRSGGQRLPSTQLKHDDPHTVAKVVKICASSYLNCGNDLATDGGKQRGRSGPDTWCLHAYFVDCSPVALLNHAVISARASQRIWLLRRQRDQICAALLVDVIHAQ